MGDGGEQWSSLNVSLERKKRRCAECTRPLANGHSGTTCPRCVEAAAAAAAAPAAAAPKKAKKAKAKAAAAGAAEATVAATPVASVQQPSVPTQQPSTSPRATLGMRAVGASTVELDVAFAPPKPLPQATTSAASSKRADSIVEDVALHGGVGVALAACAALVCAGVLVRLLSRAARHGRAGT